MIICSLKHTKSLLVDRDFTQYYIKSSNSTNSFFMVTRLGCKTLITINFF